ncbi:MAG: glycosyltransferase family 2 protein [Acidobacteria bacterium]|nr:glycosyltransferase family 2 protein [Acidobacteriota bacterium]
MNPTVSLIVVNYNGKDFIAECLDSILRQSRPPEEVIVVDNASSDNSRHLVQSYREVKLIALGRNVGYPAACNQGIDASQGNLVAVLNNDIVLDPRWLEHLIAAVASPWDFWASRIVFSSDPSRIDSAGDGMAVIGSAFKIGHRQPASRYLESKEVFGCCAAAALYRRSVLEDLGGFDPDFFLVYEDADLNMRARLRGFRCLYVPEALVLHRVNSSIGTFSNSYVYHGHRNSEVVFWKNMPASLLLRYLPERILFNLISFVYFLFKGRGGPFIKSKLDFVRMFPKIIEKRRGVQTSRRIAPSQLKTLLERNWTKYRRKVAITP